VCVGGVYYVATNRTEVVVNESRAELHMCIEGIELRSWS